MHTHHQIPGYATGLDKEPDNSPPLSDPKLYREIVGSLIYAITATRPDLSYVVTKLSQKMSTPSMQDMFQIRLL